MEILVTVTKYELDTSQTFRKQLIVNEISSVIHLYKVLLVFVSMEQFKLSLSLQK